MLTGKQLIIATRSFAQEDRFRSWGHVFSTILLIAGTFTTGLLISFWPVKLILGVLLGLLLVRMFVIYHDFLHRTILQGSLLANMVFYPFGLYILAPYSIWRRSHNHHHKHNSKLFTSSIGSYPVVTREKFLNASRGEQRIYLFIRHPITVLSGYIFAFVWGMCLLSLIRNPAKHWDSGIALLFHYGIGFSILLAFGWPSFVFLFVFPALISGGMGSYLFYAQHNFPEVEFKKKDAWSYYEAAMRSSSYMKMGKIMQWFTANIGFHHIHHINAKIPFYRLPEAFEYFPEFQNPKTTSLNPRDIWACFQLKVWDPEANRMLKLKEIQKG